VKALEIAEKALIESIDALERLSYAATGTDAPDIDASA
jgi:hypothetical protein